MDNGFNGPSQVNVLSGTHSISAPITLNDDLQVSEASGTSLTLSGSVSDNGKGYGIELNGGGQLILSGTGNYGGGVEVDGGTLVVKSSTALPDGTSLIVGAGGASIGFSPAAAAVGGGAAAGIAAVPEPGTLLLLLAALCGAVACRRLNAAINR